MDQRGRSGVGSSLLRLPRTLAPQLNRTSTCTTYGVSDLPVLRRAKSAWCTPLC